MENEHLKQIVGIVKETFVFFTFSGYPETQSVRISIAWGVPQLAL